MNIAGRVVTLVDPRPAVQGPSRSHSMANWRAPDGTTAAAYGNPAVLSPPVASSFANQTVSGVAAVAGCR